MNYSTVVIDASAAIRAIWPISPNSIAIEQLEKWHQDRIDMIAPEIW